MATAGATKGVLLVGVLVTVSALPVAMRLGRAPIPDIVAPPSASASDVSEGWAALERHDATAAAAIFAHALKNRPRDPTLHFGAGAAALGLGNRAAALTWLRTAVDLDPSFVQAQMLLGRVAYERGDSELAIQSMEKVTTLRPGDRTAAELLETWRREFAVHRSYTEKPVAHFQILYEGSTQRSIGDRVAQVLERERERIGVALNSYPAEAVTVIIYTDREFRELTRSPAWATGHFDGRIRIMVGGEMSAEALDRLVAHELVHAVVADAAPRGVPAWLNEGLATYLESNDRRWIPEALRKAGTIVPLTALERGFAGLDEQSAIAAYAESAVAAEILHGRLGANLGAFLKLVGSGAAVDNALLEFQVQPNAFHAEWRRRVGLP
jgi:tetratricopeptide (TPR) repeat protein